MDDSTIEKLGTPIAIVIGAAILGAALYFGNGTGQAPAPVTTGTQPQAPAVDSSKISTTDDPYIGNANAKLTIVEFFDYQCPFCKQVEQQVLPQLIANYVATGKARIVFKDFQFLGSDSQTAGMAARAVWEVAPGKFQAWHEAMFVNQDNENGGWGSKADILALTKSLGIDSARVDQLMTQNATAYQKEMDADKSEGAMSGVNGTPAFIIGKQLVPGAQSYDVVAAAVEAAIK